MNPNPNSKEAKLAKKLLELKSLSKCKSIDDVLIYLMSKFSYKSVEEVKQKYDISILTEFLDIAEQLENKAIDFSKSIQSFQDNIAHYNEIAYSEEIQQHFDFAMTKVATFNPKIKSVLTSNKIEPGSFAIELDKKTVYEILYVFSTSVLVKNDKKIRIIEKSSLRPCDDLISKIDPTEIYGLYSQLEEFVSVTKSDYDCIEYFSYFSDYFKIDEKILYNLLPIELKNKLLTLLNRRVQVKIKSINTTW